MSQNQKNLLWAFLCPILFIIVLWNLIPFVYGIVDDRTMMEVVSGQYLGTPDPHTGWRRAWTGMPSAASHSRADVWL